MMLPPTAGDGEESPACGIDAQNGSKWRIRSLLMTACVVIGAMASASSVLVSAQKTYISGTGVPMPGTFRHLPNAYFIFGVDRKFVIPSDATDKHATVRFEGLSLSKDSSEIVQNDPSWSAQASAVGEESASEMFGGESDPSLRLKSPAAVEIAFVSYTKLKRMMNEASRLPFCCRSMPLGSDISFKPTSDCPYPGAIRRAYLSSKPLPNSIFLGEKINTGDANPADDEDDDPMYVQPVPFHGSPEASKAIEFSVKSTDIYFFVISNCGGFTDLSLEGAVSARNAFGYLPGCEYPSFVFYLAMLMVNLLIAIIWGSCLLRQRKNLIAFHHCLGGIATIAVIESCMKFLNFYYWNSHPDRSMTLFVASVFVSVLKNICSYVLLLLGALRWSITNPTLDKKTVMKIKIIAVLYVILDTTRQLPDEYTSGSGSLSLLRLLLILLPISVINVIVFYWIFSSLHNNIVVLTREKQHEKLMIYRRLFFLLFGVLLLATILLITQIYVASWDPSDRWEKQGVLSECLPQVLYALVLISLMIIWKPHEHSKRLAYFTEIGDDDELESGGIRGAKAGTDMQVWGEELDFQDHFSDEDFEEGGAANLKLDADIPTFTSVALRDAGPKAAVGGEVLMGQKFVKTGEAFTASTIGKQIEETPQISSVEMSCVGSAAAPQENESRPAYGNMMPAEDVHVIGRASLERSIESVEKDIKNADEEQA